MFQLWKRLKDLPKPACFSPKTASIKSRGKSPRRRRVQQIHESVQRRRHVYVRSFPGRKRIPTFDWLNAATGWKLTPGDYMLIGERIQTLKQAFNVKHGIEPKDNFMSSRLWGRHPRRKAPTKAGRWILRNWRPLLGSVRLGQKYRQTQKKNSAQTGYQVRVKYALRDYGKMQRLRRLRPDLSIRRHFRRKEETTRD
jgi:hypothetical protein